MLHACLYNICFVFCYTSWRFSAFSRTNLLTRCHNASSLFSTIFVFQKSYTGNILGIGQNKSQSSYFSRHKTESKAEMEGSRGRRTIGWRSQPLACTTRWCGPLAHLPTPPFCRGDDFWGMPRVALSASWRRRNLHDAKSGRLVSSKGLAAPAAGWRLHHGEPEPAKTTRTLQWLLHRK
jgi:hypothetical protein